jgi:hypothetical protein
LNKKSILLLFVVLLTFGFAAPAQTEAATSVMVSSEFEVYSNDGSEFLGTLSTNKYDSESIFNKYGNYGSKYSTTSIWNPYGTYGSKYMSGSAFNPYSYAPPVIVYDGQAIAYISVNKYLAGAISPYQLWNEAKAIDGLK